MNLALLKRLEGSDITAPRLQLSQFDSPYVQEHLGPFIQEQAKRKTIILAGPSSVNKTEFARVVHGPSVQVGDIEHIRDHVHSDTNHIVGDDFDFSSIGVGSRTVTEQDLVHLFEVDEDSDDIKSVNARNVPARVSTKVKNIFHDELQSAVR